MKEPQILTSGGKILLAGTEFIVRILLNGRVYFTHPNGKVYQETSLRGTLDTGVRYLTSWNNQNVLYHHSQSPYVYIVLGKHIIDITKSFAAFGQISTQSITDTEKR